jgi:CheY-like chemotaxis protein
MDLDDRRPTVSPDRVLIVDNDPGERLPMIKALRGAGLGVLTADDAISAISVALREKPRVIVLDLKLPGGGGYQVIERLQTLPATAATAIVVCTAEDPARHRRAALAAGAVEFLRKPVDGDELLATLRFVLGPGLGSAGPEPAGPATVLVVDDDPDVRRTLLLLFQAQGYNVVMAEDAISAVAIARARAPQVVVLDIGLPGGEGFTVMERLRAVPDLAATPVVVISGRDPEQMRRRAEQAGAVAFLQKPTDNRELLQAVRDALG